MVPRLRVLLTLVAILALVPAAAWAAGGGTTIAAAPLVPPETPQFGNLAVMPDNIEYWKSSFFAGDHYSLDIDLEQTGKGFNFCLYPAGTDDYSQPTTSCESELDWQHASFNRFALLSGIASKSGLSPLLVQRVYGSAGPYTFTLHVKHQTLLFLPAANALKRVGMLQAQVRRPDGSAVDDANLQVGLQASWSGRWHIVGTAASHGGKALIRYTLPRQLVGKTIGVRLRASGASYLLAFSRSKHITVK